MAGTREQNEKLDGAGRGGEIVKADESVVCFGPYLSFS
jgi:hypothetical protein